MCVATLYGEYGFVGELIVRLEMRGNGIGRRLLDSAVAYLRDRGALSILLDGVVAAVPLYERAGFRRVCRSHRFSGAVAGAPQPNVRAMGHRDLEAVLRLDRRAFGADRGFFLTRRFACCPELAYVGLGPDGEIAAYVLARRAGDGIAVGPWVSHPHAGDAAAVVRALARASGEAPLTMGVLAANPDALDAARGLGLRERADPPWRMALGPSAALGASGSAYAIGAPSKG